MMDVHNLKLLKEETILQPESNSLASMESKKRNMLITQTTSDNMVSQLHIDKKRLQYRQRKYMTFQTCSTNENTALLASPIVVAIFCNVHKVEYFHQDTVH